MKLLLFPLFIMFLVSMLSTSGLGSSMQSTHNIYLLGDPTQGYFDSNGHMVAYANKTAYDDTGTLKVVTAPGNWGELDTRLKWDNGTGTLYVVTDYTGSTILQKHGGTFELFSNEGLIAIIAVVGVIGGVVSIFAGDLGASLAFKGGVLVAIWGVFSVINLTLITAVPLVGPVFYLGLTVMYAMGIINQVGSPESV